MRCGDRAEAPGVRWLTSGAARAAYHSPTDLPVRVHRHGSLLLRELEGVEMVRNDTATTFRLRTWVGRRHLHGELRADRELPVSCSVEAAASAPRWVRTAAYVAATRPGGP